MPEWIVMIISASKYYKYLNHGLKEVWGCEFYSVKGLVLLSAQLDEKCWTPSMAHVLIYHLLARYLVTLPPATLIRAVKMILLSVKALFTPRFLWQKLLQNHLCVKQIVVHLNTTFFLVRTKLTKTVQVLFKS